MSRKTDGEKIDELLTSTASLEAQLGALTEQVKGLPDAKRTNLPVYHHP